MAVPARPCPASLPGDLNGVEPQPMRQFPHVGMPSRVAELETVPERQFLQILGQALDAGIVAPWTSTGVTGMFRTSATAISWRK